MAKSSSMLFLLTLLPALLTSHSLPTNSKPKPNFPSPHRFTKIYAFGDSFTDTGNTHSTTAPYSFGYVSSPPYGTTFFHRSTNRYSDGRLIIDFLANSLSLPFVPPYLSRNSDFSHGVNFAVAGSTAIEYEFYVKHNISIDIVPVSIMTELGWYDKLLQEKKWADDMEKTLFWVGEVGANDYGYSVISSTLVPDQIRNLAVNNVNNFVEVLFSLFLCSY
jgi:phospholipase/lecithinase/hemolysin